MKDQTKTKHALIQELASLRDRITELEQSVSERRQAEKYLLEAERRLHKIYEHSSDVIYTLDRDFRVTSVSGSVERHLGYRAEELVGRSFADLDMVAPESLEAAFKDSLQVLAGDTVPTAEYVFIRKDGSRAIGEVSGSPLLEDGKITGLISIARDVTGRKRAEDALRESERKYKLITEKMTDIVWMADMDLRTVYVTPSVQTVLGFSQEERMLQTVDEQLTPESLSFGLDAMARELAMEEQGPQDPARSATLILEYYHKDGSTRWMETVISGIRNDQGVLTGLHGVSRDITSRKLAEEELENARDQLRALAIRLQEVREETRTSMSRDLHDDVGANLAGLKMDLMKLGELAAKIPDAGQRTALMEVSHRAKELINTTIRSARRIMMELRPSVLDDFGLMAALEWQVGEFKTHTGISCQLVSEQQEVTLEKQSTTAVFRIFQETLANVARHSGATEVIVRLSSDKEMLILEVTDNGRGITKEQLLGKESLGLMGMRERSLALGGSIQVRGESGKGTTVTLRVPMGRESFYQVQCHLDLSDS